jgi:Carboxylesterase family
LDCGDLVESLPQGEGPVGAANRQWTTARSGGGTLLASTVVVFALNLVALPTGVWAHPASPADGAGRLAFGITTNLEADQQVLANQVTAERRTFARTGNPTAKGTPVWRRFTTATKEVMSLQPAGDSQITTANSISLDHNCGFWDSLSR